VQNRVHYRKLCAEINWVHEKIFHSTKHRPGAKLHPYHSKLERTFISLQHYIAMFIPNRARAQVVQLVFLLVCGSVAQAQLRISEFMASNTRTLLDEDGETSDWIELHNFSSTNVNLRGWYLTDSAGNLRKWSFPETNLAPDRYIVVFASGKDRRTPGKPLHTNFKLAAEGEYLALVKPDGATVVSEFAPNFPPQLADVAYGYSVESVTSLLITTDATARVHVPLSPALGLTWTEPAFDDSTWTPATNGIGFETGSSELGSVVPNHVLDDNPAGYWRLNETGGGIATNSGWINGTGNGQFVGGVTIGVAGPRPSAFAGFESNNCAVRLNGSGARVEVPFTPELNPSAAFTVEAWVKPSRYASTSTACPVSSIYMPSGSASRSGFALYQTTANQWQFVLGNSSGYVARPQGGTVVTNNWQYLVGVYDGSTAKLYVNGTLVASASLSGPFEPNTSEKFIIGGRNNINPYYFAGDVDEVSVIARALSGTEIARRYQIATTGQTPTNLFNYTGLIKTDIRTNMLGVNSSVYLRLPFMLTNADPIEQLTLRVRYDDGFAAFLDGVPVAGDNAPESLAWNSGAQNRRATALALCWRSFDLADAIGYLHQGTNVLAVHGLNFGATNQDLLVQVELEASSYRYASVPSYLTKPTPGAENVVGIRDLGPIISPAGFNPPVPTTNDSIVVTCRVTQAFAPVSTVTLNWRVMYGQVQQTQMFDDGLHSDGAAGDSVFGGVIPNQVGGLQTYTAGQMVRWFITASDSLSRTSRWPLFANPLDSAQYDGTVVQPDYVTSALPVFHLFVNPADYSAADSESGARASLYYDGEFYDNIYIEIRGNTSAWLAKKSYRLEFNRDHPFRYDSSGKRVRKTSLLAEYVDPSYLRQYLSFWLLNLAGVPAPFHYPVRVQRNGEFYQLAFHSEVLGEEQLERLGYNPAGALYKAAGTITPDHYSTGGFQKLLPKTNGVVVPGTADFDALANAISETLALNQRRINVFDLLDLPEIINYLAVARFVQEADDVWANMTLYRDTWGSGEWSVIPFDMNLSWGQLYYGNYPNVYNQLIATNDFYKSHPLYGGSQIQEAGASAWNRIYDVIIAVPETRQMLLRRMRTLMGRFIQPPGTSFAEGIVEQHICVLTNLIWAEAFLDRQKWGWPPNSGPYGLGPNLWLTNGVNDLIDKFLKPRRQHFFSTHCVTNTAKPVGLSWASNAGIPTSQPTNAAVYIIGLDYNPVSGNQDEEYVCLTNPNPYAVDISGWRLDGDVQFTFRPGTVMPSNSVLYVSPNVKAFRTRTLSPRGGQGLFVQGNYTGRLSAWGGTVTLEDDSGRTVSTNSYTGNPSLAQQYLRITELMYNPDPAPSINPDPQQFEYIELKNISDTVWLDLTGVRFVKGISFDFTGSAVTNLAPGATVLVVRNTAAFTARYGSGLPIAGQYIGALDNAGEELQLEDAVGETILEFAYNNAWYPITDGLGFSLVIVDEHAPWFSWGLKSSWRPSGRWNGSPGQADPRPPDFPQVRVNEAMSHNTAGSDWIELYNPGPTNVDLGGWFLTDDFYNPKRYRIPPGTVIGPASYIVFYGNTSFGTGTTGFGLSKYGEAVWLFSGDATTNLTGYCHGFDFGPAPANVSFGRYINSQNDEHFVLVNNPTPGTNNAAPRVGPIVISEIMYNPPSQDDTNDWLNEFIELHNITATNVPLFCVYTNEPGYGLAALTNTWRLRNAVDFDFPTNVVMPPGSRLLVVPFDPVSDHAQLDSFRSRYGVPTNVPIFGPWTGKLNNAGETVELKYPDKPEFVGTNLIVPYVLAEQISYQPGLPWPTNANGLGASLQRLISYAYGNDPTNWSAATPTPGWINAATPPPVITAISRSGTILTVTANVQPGITYRLEFKNALDDSAWIPIMSAVTASAPEVVLSDTNATCATRFYRICAW